MELEGITITTICEYSTHIFLRRLFVMANYRVFVNGIFVGVNTFTLEEIKRINNDPTISLSKLD